MKKERIKLTTEEALRVNRLASAMVDKIVCGETLRLALPIIRLMHEKVIVTHGRIKKKYGEVI